MGALALGCEDPAKNRDKAVTRYAGRADDLIRDDVAIKLTIRSKPRPS